MELLTMTEKLISFDPAESLRSEEGIALFMADAMETGDAAHIAYALGVVARARGMAQLARETGLSREHLFRALREDGNPTLKTLLAIMKALNIDLSAKAHTPKTKPAARKRVTRATPKSATRASR
jgi:probable addiction module antidote protein